MLHVLEGNIEVKQYNKKCQAWHTTCVRYVRYVTQYACRYSKEVEKSKAYACTDPNLLCVCMHMYVYIYFRPNPPPPLDAYCPRFSRGHYNNANLPIQNGNCFYFYIA